MTGLKGVLNEIMDRNGIPEASRTESLLDRESNGAKRGKMSKFLLALEGEGSELDADELFGGSWATCYRSHAVKIQSRKTCIYSPRFRLENALSRAHLR